MDINYEQNKTLIALQAAIQMEIDGKEYYLKNSRESSNETGKKLFESLAVEEDIHQQNFTKIYEAIKNKEKWEAINTQHGGGKNLQEILKAASETIDTDVSTKPGELDAVQTAMNMENKTFDFYIKQSEAAAYNTERDFYYSLAAEERRHHQVLLSYYEYLKDPAAWFLQEEHSSLDGG